MLPARARLRRSTDFAAAVRRGPGTTRVGRPLLVLHAVAGPFGAGPDSHDPSDAVPARAGLVVSRAVGPAVTRNQVKRRLRHLLRDRLPSLPPGLVLVVRANPAAAGAGSRKLAADLDGALRTLLARLPAGPRTGGSRAGDSG